VYLVDRRGESLFASWYNHGEKLLRRDDVPSTGRDILSLCSVDSCVDINQADRYIPAESDLSAECRLPLQ
jgi:hypothetical protein